MLVSYPEQLRRIAESCTKKHPESSEKAARACLSKMKKTPEFESWTNDLIMLAVQRLVWECRHHTAMQIKKDTTEYGGPAVVKPGSESVDVLYESIFDYPIANTTLGNLKFSDLPEVAEMYQEQVDGLRFKIRLCETLYRKRPRKLDCTVREGIKETALRKIFSDLQQKESDKMIA